MSDPAARSSRALGGPGAVARAAEEILALFEEVTDVDRARMDWLAVARALALGEVAASRTPSADAASRAFELALRANSAPGADTFMAVEAAAPPADPEARVRRAAARALRVAEGLAALDDHAPDQPLVAALALDGGWLRTERLARRAGRVPIAFLVGPAAFVADVDPRDDGEVLADRLDHARRGAPGAGLRRIDPAARIPAPAAAAIALDPVPSWAARSFHRLAWTRGGGPWMGVADGPRHAVVSTCHAAVDGYLHARVTEAVLAPERSRTPRAGSGEGAADGPGPAHLAWRGERPPEVGFATLRVDPAPRFGAALHAFGVVLDAALGVAEASRSVAFHVPLAPGVATDARRWRRRPIHGLFALHKRAGRLESREAVAARLPAWLAREADGAGLLTRTLRAIVELPLPDAARRRLIARRPWMDRTVAAARVLTGGGYVSWMRFEDGLAPAVPIYPSAIPSFSDRRGGAGLSIVRGAEGISVGLTTSGALGTDAAAARFLADWREALDGAGG